MKYNIKTFSGFILNETLTTHDIDITIKNVNTELLSLRYNFEIIKNDNSTISIKLLNFNKTFGVGIHLENLNSLMIDRNGWFPSTMKITKFSGLEREFSYDENLLLNDDENIYFEKVEIIYESKYDIESEVPNKLYHISIQEFESNTLKNGLIPKSKSKLSNHLDRLYVCSDIEKCYNLIPKMKFIYTNKRINNKQNKINDKWIIYEINSRELDIKLYKDPNYIKGFYIVENIPKNLIKVTDKEI